VKAFADPERLLGGLDAISGATLIAAASDVALILDTDGVIRDFALGNDALSFEDCSHWLGRRWSETVTIDSRAKVEALLKEAESNPASKWRHINHHCTEGVDLPILYSVVRVWGRSESTPMNRSVALGRDLRPTAALQQRLVESQQSREQDYWRLRHAETSYKLLFQLVSEPLLIVDASTMKVMDGNPAAERLLGGKKPLVGGLLNHAFDEASGRLIRAHLSAVRAFGRSDDVIVRTADGSRVFGASGTLVRRDDSSIFIVRLSSDPGEASPSPIPEEQAMLLDVIANAPDAFVITDLNGCILRANAAFINLAQLAAENLARGEILERWLGPTGVEFGVLLANLRQHGSIRLFKTLFRGELGASAEVEISAVAVTLRNCLGFAIRDVSRRISPEPKPGGVVPRSVQELTELVGRVPLRDLVREATDLIERLCMEAALELAGDNRAAAAEMLGLSRQSFYVKLRRHGLGDLAIENESDGA
jgi:transcriptional regulator PpsR